MEESPTSPDKPNNIPEGQETTESKTPPTEVLSEQTPELQIAPKKHLWRFLLLIISGLVILFTAIVSIVLWQRGILFSKESQSAQTDERILSARVLDLG